MRIGIFAKVIKSEFHFNLIKDILNFIESQGAKLLIQEQLYNELIRFQFPSEKYTSFITVNQINPEIDYLITIGGDGTILDSVEIIHQSGVPLIGLNTGRLGFLANVSIDHLKQAFNELSKGSFILDKRSLLELHSHEQLFDYQFALNDFVLHKKETSSMIIVHAFLNGEPLNSYWADGLIVSTPTGSSGYSLSCGGPILFPKTSSFVITPIAPHHLNVRPVIVPDDQVLSFEIEGRSNNFLASLDSRSTTIQKGAQIAIRKADFQINLVRFTNNTYLSNLREKMLWGSDLRN